MFPFLPPPLSENVAESNSICDLSEVMRCYIPTPDVGGATKGVTEAELD